MNMTVLLIVFGSILGVLTVALMVLGVAEIRLYRRRKEFEESKNDIASPEPEVVCAEDAVIRVRGAEVVCAANEESGETGVVISRSEKKTFSEKYQALPQEKRELLDEFSAKFCKFSECGKVVRSAALLFRYRKSRVAVCSIKKDAVLLSFAIQNPNLGRLARDNKSVKIKPVRIRLSSREDLKTALSAAELTLNYLKEEEEYKLQKRKEKRREAARLRREEVARAKDVRSE